MPVLPENDHARLAVVETKVEYVEGAIKANAKKLGEIDYKVDVISNNMMTFNATFPRLESNVNKLIEKINFDEKEMTKTTTKVKISWAILSSILTGSLLVIIKIALGV